MGKKEEQEREREREEGKKTKDKKGAEVEVEESPGACTDNEQSYIVTSYSIVIPPCLGHVHIIRL